ncbi:MAG: hypothetical protein AAB561_00960 [Patescibacteria group bacterium]
MTAQTDVTTNQTDHLCKIANDMGISRVSFQRWLDKEAAKMLATLKSLLEVVCTVAVSAVEHFAAADHFKVDTGDTTIVRIGYLGDNFRANLLSKVEKNVPAAELVVHRLTKNSLDKDIREELGADCEETTLAHLWEMLTRQSRGQKGNLLTNGYANICYIKDAKGKLWAVNVYWDADFGGWHVCAGSVEYPLRWIAGYQVFSR